MSSKIEIPLSKAKITVVLTGATAFVIIGIICIIIPEMFVSRIFRNPEIIRISGIIGVSFFGLCWVFVVKTLFSSRIGLTIDDYGITDNTNATSVGLIEWGDITEIETNEVMGTKFLVIHTNNPQKYINRATNRISKQAMIINYKTYSSPISIISNSLKINFNNLEKMIKYEFEKRRQSR